MSNQEDSKITDAVVVNDNSGAVLHEENEDQVKQRKLAAFQHQAAMLLDELKKLFTPDMRITFIARSVEDKTRYSLLTEETENDALIELLTTSPKPTTLQRPDSQNVTN